MCTNCFTLPVTLLIPFDRIIIEIQAEKSQIGTYTCQLTVSMDRDPSVFHVEPVTIEVKDACAET